MQWKAQNDVQFKGETTLRQRKSLNHQKQKRSAVKPTRPSTHLVRVSAALHLGLSYRIPFVGVGEFADAI
jgi:hypothetical protein